MYDSPSKTMARYETYQSNAAEAPMDSAEVATATPIAAAANIR